MRTPLDGAEWADLRHYFSLEPVDGPFGYSDEIYDAAADWEPIVEETVVSLGASDLEEWLTIWRPFLETRGKARVGRQPAKDPG